MRRFLARFVLATAGTWLAATVIPGVRTDGALLTFILMGLFIATGEIIVQVLQQGAAILLFFLPRSVRMIALRLLIVGIATALVTGFAFESPFGVGLVGTTLLLSLLFLLPLAS